MVDLPDRSDRNKLRAVVAKAQADKVMTREEAGFAITLVERFRKDIKKKEKQLLTIQGEIGQLKLNEQIIIQLIESMVSAAERDIARQETMAKLKEAREVEEARHIERAERNKAESQKDEGELPQAPPALNK